MANPANVLNFFDLAGSWDPSLIFVMGSAFVTTLIGYRLVLRHDGRVMAARFLVPTSTKIDKSLLGGSALFGVGWELAGFCPGGALPALGTGRIELVIFVAALIAGILATRFVIDALQQQTSPETPAQQA